MKIWRIGSFSQNLAWIHSALSEKRDLKNGRRTVDDGRLRHDSGSANKVKRS